MLDRFRIRKKGDKHMIEMFENGRWIGRTLYPEKIWNWLMSNEKQNIMSNSTQEQKQKVPQKFSQSKLCELDETDTNKTFPTEKDILESLKETMNGEAMEKQNKWHQLSESDSPSVRQDRAAKLTGYSQ